MKLDHKKLLNKGWSQEEVDHAKNIIAEADAKKHKTDKVLDATIYWALLFLLTIGNAVVSSVLIPFVFAIKGSFIIFLVLFAGFSFGVFFSILIADINKHETRYNNKLIISLVAAGIINFILISQLSIEFSILTGLPLRHDPYLIAGLYLFSFLTPHITFILRECRKKA